MLQNAKKLKNIHLTYRQRQELSRRENMEVGKHLGVVDKLLVGIGKCARVGEQKQTEQGVLRVEPIMLGVQVKEKVFQELERAIIRKFITTC